MAISIFLSWWDNTILLFSTIFIFICRSRRMSFNSYKIKSISITVSFFICYACFTHMICEIYMYFNIYLIFFCFSHNSWIRILSHCNIRRFFCFFLCLFFLQIECHAAVWCTIVTYCPYSVTFQSSLDKRFWLAVLSHFRKAMLLQRILFLSEKSDFKDLN